MLLEPSLLKNMSTRPGVYQMMDARGRVIYVGKARNLKNRLASYFRKQLDTKTQSMMQQAKQLEITITSSDTEALLLESNLIKALKPRYNVLLRDDKAYPYLQITTEQIFPRLYFYRGERKKEGRSFGPYPNIGSVRDNLSLLQKLFRLRQCNDTFFKHRTRPCLQYQIKRCTAPCVGYVSEADYQEQVEEAILFLEGDDSKVMDHLTQKMNHASENQAYEKAAMARDQIIQLRKLQDQQVMNRAEGDADIVLLLLEGKIAVISLLMVRQGRVLGNKVFYPRFTYPEKPEAILTAFISQYYLSRAPKELPANLIIKQPLENKTLLKSILKQEKHLTLQTADKPREPLKSWFKLVDANAQHALKNALTSNERLRAQYHQLQSALKLADPIKRMECFDISHTMGEATKAACVVFDENGPAKKYYRAYNITGITPGDDYAAMEQVLKRRYEKLKSLNKPLPDVIVIDGGKGQLTQAVRVLQTLQMIEVTIIGLAKGPARKAGLENIFKADEKQTVSIELAREGRLLLQQIRDEAHRFAITSHRKARAKKRAHSPLENIPGVGEKRRQAILAHFGGWQALSNAAEDQIAQIKGISPALAKIIYNRLHEKE